jgi:hypothetical protein
MSDGLLSHEQGHYLIGGMCALEFLRRVDNRRRGAQDNFDETVGQIFDRTMREFLELEKRYDFETQHRQNFKMQEKWDHYICSKLARYQHIFEEKELKQTKLPKLYKGRKSITDR